MKPARFGAAAAALLALWASTSTGVAGAASLEASTTSTTIACPAGPGTCSPGPPVVDPADPSTDEPCEPEQFPRAGAPVSSADVPYEIPFTATLGPDPAPAGAQDGVYPAGTEAGGWLEIRGTSRTLDGAQVVLILGGPVVNSKGFIYAAGCGLTGLPSEVGGLGAQSYTPTGTGGQINPNFVFDTETPVSIGLTLPGLTLSPNVASGIVAYGSANGFLKSDIQLKPAANGGLNVDFYSSAKSTTNLSQLLSLLGTSASGQDCTVAIGDLNYSGLPVPPGGAEGLPYSEATALVHLSTTQSVPDPVTGQPDAGQPVTGPIAPTSTGLARTSAVLAANSFAIGEIEPWPTPATPAEVASQDLAVAPDEVMPPAPGEPGDDTCSASNASMLNNLVGLPNPVGENFFYAPGTFGVYTSS